MQTTFFFYLERFLKKLADDQCYLITKGSIYHIKHLSTQPFTMGVAWPEIARLMEVSIMFNSCTYCLLTLYDRYNRLCSMERWHNVLEKYPRENTSGYLKKYWKEHRLACVNFGAFAILILNKDTIFWYSDLVENFKKIEVGNCC